MYAEIARPRVLIVDGDARTRSPDRVALQSEAVVLEANDGEEAVAIVASIDVDLVLLCATGLGRTTFEVCRRLRALRPEEYLPIVVSVPRDGATDRLAAFDAGADECIEDPLSNFELQARVRALLRNRRLHLEHAAMREQLTRLIGLKDDLVALLVHDLRNPLAGMLAHLACLDGEVLSSAAEDSLQGVRLASARLRDIIDDLEQVRRIEDGVYTATRRAGDVVTVLREAVATMRASAQQYGVRLGLLSEAQIALDFDEHLVRRAIENLITNAIHHSGAGSTVLLRAEHRGDMVVVAVLDDGVGIPPDARALYFTKYGATELRRTGSRSGRGLGLYLVHLVMQAHDGSVHLVEGAPRGTCVELAFPRRPPERPRLR